TPLLADAPAAVRASALIDAPCTARRGEVEVVLAMHHAGERRLRIGYEIVGPADAPVVLVAGGISAHRHAAASETFPEAGWVDGLVAPGRALDPARRRI